MRNWLIFMVMAQVSAQEVFFEGVVQDNLSKEPIPYVNLSFLNTLKGTSTNEDGHFFMDMPKSYLERQVHISSLGYRDTIVNAKKLYREKVFGMVEESYELEEVVVTENLSGLDILNPINSYSLNSGFTSSATPWVVALYFPNIGAQKKYLDKVTLFLKCDENFKRETSRFRLRVYNVDPVTKKPSVDLVHKSIVLEHLTDQEYVSVDLSALNIRMPTAGIYIGVEWLFIPYNWYKETGKHPITGKSIVEDRFAPTIQGMYTKNHNFNVMVYGMGEWNDFTVRSLSNEEKLIPAFSLKLKK